MRLRRTIPIFFALLGVLMSLSTVSAAPWVMRSTTEPHKCCQPKSEKTHDHDRGNDGCLAACCRVITTTDHIDILPSGEEPIAIPAMSWSIVALNLTDPDSIFHPPRV
jgi:hypothetical protein